jgi:hypothetical protein
VVGQSTQELCGWSHYTGTVLVVQEVLEDDDFLKVSSAWRLVNISGTEKVIDLKF